jgi:hypothetical protein
MNCKKIIGYNLLKELNVQLEFLCWECIDDEGLEDFLCMGYNTIFECVMKHDLSI